MVKIDFEELMRSKSDDGLRVYIDDSVRYQPEAVQAAIAELERRGNPVPVEEIVEIKQQEEKINAEQKEKIPFKFPYDQVHLVTDDVNAPLLYSRSAIFICTVLLGGLFGSILMAINIRKNNYNGVLQIVFTGMIYAILAFIITPLYLRYQLGLLLPISILTALVLTEYIWPKHIGKNTAFRLNSVTIPVIVWLCVVVAMVLLGSILLAFLAN